jgi:trk system potassium uptake protein TrkA
VKVIVCGGGQVGSSLVRYLAAHDNDVTVVDLSDEVINDLSRLLDVKGIVGFASHPDVLIRAGIGEADMLIAVTSSDEVNMVACQISHYLFNVPIKIACIRSKNYLSPEYVSFYNSDDMSIDLIISPELEVAQSISRGLTIPGAFEVAPFADQMMQLVGIRCYKSQLLNTPLRLLGSLFPKLELNVMFMIREGKGFVPQDTDQLQEGDEVYLLISQSHLQDVMELFGFTEQSAQRLLILGGGNVGFFLAEEIEEHHPDMSLMLIENNKERAIQIANQLARTIVLQGDALNQDILREGNVKIADKVIAVTDDDKVNILASLLAKRMGAQHAMALIKSPSYSNIMNSLGIDSVISPQSLTASGVLRYVRRGRIRAVHSLRNDFGQVMEVEAMSTSNVLGKTVGELNTIPGFRIGAIVREDRILIPEEETMIKAHDQVIMMVTDVAIKKFEKLFAVRMEYA